MKNKKLIFLLYMLVILMLPIFSIAQTDNRSPEYRFWGVVGINTQGYSTLKDTAHYALQVGDSALGKGMIMPIGDTATIPPQKGGFIYNLSDSSLYYSDGHKWLKNDANIDTVNTISQLEAYNRLPNVNLIYVTDSLRGGLFYRESVGTPDSGTVFPSNLGGFWIRSWNHNTAMIEWFGAKGDGLTQDAMNIQQAFNQGFIEYSSENKTHVFLINMPLTVLDSEKLYNINFKRANQNETIVTQNITSGTYANPVINVQNGYAFSIGQYVSLLDTVKNEWINRNAIYKIVSQTPSTVTLGGTITIDSNFIANQTILYTTFSLISCGNYDIINRVNINGNSQNNPYARWVSQSEISTNGNYNLIGETNIDSASGEGIICYLNNNKFDNDNIINSGGNGIHFSGAYNNVVNGAVIINSNLDTLVGHVGGNITWSVQSGYTTVSNSYLENGKHSFGNISDNLSGNLTLTGNTCVNARSGVLDMVGTANYPTPIQNIIFSNNRVYNCGMTSISGGGFPNFAYNNIKIDGNYFFNSPFYLNGVENINFSNNTFTDTINAKNSSCFDINNSKNISVNNNVIDGYYYGIHIFNGSDSSVNIVGNTLNSQKMYGIISILATGVNISSNNINNNSNDSTGYIGIEVDSNSIVQNNSLLLDIGSSGIIGSGNNNNIKNNYVRGTVNVGIRLFGNSYKNIVQGNILGGSVPIIDGSKYNYVNNNYDLNHNLLSQYNQLSNYLVLNSSSDTINMMNANSTINNILFINNSSLSVNFNRFYLPDATIFKNGVLTIKRQDSLNTVDTILCQNGQLIDSLSYYALGAKSSVTFYSDNVNWWSINKEDTPLGYNGYIQNQFSSPQSSSNYWIDGNGRINGNLGVGGDSLTIWPKTYTMTSPTIQSFQTRLNSSMNLTALDSVTAPVSGLDMYTNSLSLELDNTASIQASGATNMITGVRGALGLNMSGTTTKLWSANANIAGMVGTVSIFNNANYQNISSIAAASPFSYTQGTYIKFTGTIDTSSQLYLQGNPGSTYNIDATISNPYGIYQASSYPNRLSGGIQMPILVVTTSTTVTKSNYSVINASGTNTFTIPAASSCSGQVFHFVCNTGTVTLSIGYLNYSGTSTTTIAAGSGVTIQSNGTSYYQIAQ